MVATGKKMMLNLRCELSRIALVITLLGHTALDGAWQGRENPSGR